MKRLVLVSLAVCFLLSTLAGCARKEAPGPEKETVTIIDKTGRYVEVPRPVKRIVSLNSGMSALICAFGEGDKIVGRNCSSTFPSYLKEVFVVGKSSSHPNIELILEQKPDVVVTDPMLFEAEREKIEATGIPLIIDSTSDPDRLLPLIRNFGLILGKKEKAKEIIDYIEHSLSIVDERVEKLKLEGKPIPSVFFEFRNAYKSASAETVFHKPLVAAGGINIAAGEPLGTPKLSSEWVFQRNPDIIIKRISGDASVEEMKQIREEIMSRPGLKEVKAVKEGKVYIIKADTFLTLRYPIGVLYYAKWFHPNLFQDIDPAAVHRELVEKFFGAEEWQKLTEAFAYPEP